MTCRNEPRFRIWWWCDIGPWWTCNGYIVWRTMRPRILLRETPRPRTEKGSKSKAIRVSPWSRPRMKRILQKPWSNTKRPRWARWKRRWIRLCISRTNCSVRRIPISWMSCSGHGSNRPK
jgi:hypothetical protein